MATQELMALNVSKERPASTLSGYPMLVVLLVSIVLTVWGVVRLVQDANNPIAIMMFAGGFLVMILATPGF